MDAPDPEQMIRDGRVRLDPLSIEVIAPNDPVGADAVVDVSWEDQTQRFVVETRRDARPRTLQLAVDTARRYADAVPAARPMVVVPYLSDEKIDSLREQQVSALDCCGNGVVIVPGRWLVCQKGNANKYPERTPIGSAYRGDSSLVARALLLKPQFNAVGDIAEYIAARNGSLAISTVSKMLRRLEDDLVIERPDRNTVRLIQPQRLLDQLVDEYEPPTVRETWVGKIDLPEDELTRRFASLADDGGLVRSGASSAGYYAAFAGEPVLEFYCRRRPDEFLTQLGAPTEQTQYFPNVRLLQTDDQRVYFDRRDNLIASPIQTWLETATGDKRQKDAAEQLRRILRTYVEQMRG
ncbi:MAG: hypothetical protein KGY81_09355 [Phycisphaerae bacterium]|jgi:hypothetical protein|nr:hypothetical protein [Phycisphaerae bacterium]